VSVKRKPNGIDIEEFAEVKTPFLCLIPIIGSAKTEVDILALSKNPSYAIYMILKMEVNLI